MADPAYDAEIPFEDEIPVEDTDTSDLDLINAIRSAEKTAYGGEGDSALSSERARSIDDYLGQPYGNEVEGRSQVVSRDVHDTIEWIKPSLLRIFTSGDEVARFDPVGPEDEQAAQQETDYINYVLQDKNPWFTVAYEWFTDGLLTKNAYALAYWSTEKQIEKESYKQLTDDQLAQLTQDQSIEIVQASSMSSPEGVAYHDVVIRRTKEVKGVKICVLPPERCLVAEDVAGMSVRDASFFQYWEMVTISKLRNMGFDVPDDISDDAGELDSEEDNSRDQFSERLSRDRMEGNDPSMRKVRLKTSWVQFDYDKDGIAEHRMVMSVGSTIFYNDEANGVQVASIVPTPLPHRHPGLSVRDMVSDLQQIKTALWRGALDNIYLANNGRYGISDKVNVDDMLTSRPGGLVRVSGGFPGQEIFPIIHPQVVGDVMGVINYMDQVRSQRTGTNIQMNTVDPNVLQKGVSGVAVSQLYSAAGQIIEMIARVFAEGVKELFLIVHELSIKHGHQQEVVRLKNNWVSVNPSEWKRRSDMKISVGLGTGNKEQLMNNLQAIGIAQEKGLSLGITDAEKIYNTAVEFTKAAGFASADKFWKKPDPNAPQQPSEAQVSMQTEIQKEQIKQAGAAQIAQIEAASKERIAAYEADRKMMTEIEKVRLQPPTFGQVM
jgi:hypothetical protein